jgi:DNA end-binding protein Ku
MSRPIWKGHITFGLVNVPVVLYSAERRGDLSFRLIDSRNTARVRYDRVNEETGEEVPWDKIVKGFEYSDGNYVLLSDKELERASVEMTRTVEIEQFVDLEEIDPVYFDKPYLLVPNKGGEKGYVLLREAMAASGRVGTAQVVIRTRQHLAAMRPQKNALMLTLMRYPQELRDLAEHDLPGGDLQQYKITKKEIDMARQLIDGLSAEWDPDQFHDEYHDVLMKLIEKKIASGKTEVIESPEEAEDEEPPTINFMDVLKKSVEQTSKRRGKRAPTKKKSAPRKKTSKAKRKRA